MKYAISLLLISLVAGWAAGADNLRLAVYHPQYVNFRAVPLAAVPEVRGAMPSASPAVAKAANSMDSVAVIAGEIRRWRVGANDAPLVREPLPGDGLGRWVSLGGMPMPEVIVSVIGRPSPEHAARMKGGN